MDAVLKDGEHGWDSVEYFQTSLLFTLRHGTVHEKDNAN